MNEPRQDFCPKCGYSVEYFIREQVDTMKVRDVEFTYWEAKAYCDNCHTHIYIPWVQDLNVERRRKAFYKSSGREFIKPEENYDY